ncbi:hypothetical protein [Rosistilla oblonga]
MSDWGDRVAAESDEQWANGKLVQRKKILSTIRTPSIARRVDGFGFYG